MATKIVTPLPGTEQTNKLIRPQTCKNCKFAEQSRQPGVFECRYKPPKHWEVPVTGPDGKPSFVQRVSFPMVYADQWCGEHKPKIERVGA